MLSHKLRTIGGSQPDYWGLVFSGTIGWSSGTTKLADDDAGNIYVNGRTASNIEGFIRITDQGVPQASRKTSNSYDASTVHDIVNDGQGEVAVTGGFQRTSGSELRANHWRIIGTTAPKGSTIYDYVPGTSGDASVSNHITVNTTDDIVWTGGYSDDISTGFRSAHIVGWRTNGTMLTDRRYSETGTANFVTALDSGNDVVWHSIETSGGWDIGHSTSIGNFVAAKSFSAQGEFIAALESSTVAYVLLQNRTLMKLDSGSNITWQRLVGDSGDIPCGIAVDSSGNVFVTQLTTSSVLEIAKYNSSGTYQEGRGITVDSTIRTVVSTNSTMISNDKLYVSFGDVSDDVWVLKLPIDGTLVGTHGDITITNITVTDAAGSETAATKTLSADVAAYGGAGSNVTGNGSVDMTPITSFIGIE